MFGMTDPEPWSAPGTLISVATLLAAIATIWVTMWVANPKRELLYRMARMVPLIDVAEKAIVTAKLEVLCDGKPLREPHVAEVQLYVRGRRDISSSDFDGGPLALDLGTPIVAIRADTTADTTDLPKWTVDGNVISIVPCLIKKNQMIVFSVLTDGEPSLKVHSPLLDVERREFIDPLERLRRPLPTSIGGRFGYGALLVCATLFAFFAVTMLATELLGILGHLRLNIATRALLAGSIASVACGFLFVLALLQVALTWIEKVLDSPIRGSHFLEDSRR